MEVIPKTLAENAGLDQIDSLVFLRSHHEKGVKSAGLDMDTGKPVDMLKLEWSSRLGSRPRLSSRQQRQQS